MAQVVLENVSKIYPGGIRAANNINLGIRDREFMVLVGPSGCGKSTTLRMIAGLEQISEGVIRIGDRIINDVQPKDRDIAMVFQNYALYPHMTVYKNMAFGLKMRGYPKKEIDERVRQAAGILGLQEMLQRKPKALSGGQRQRVAVGRAIVRQPKAFLFDEPLSNLDAKLRVETRAELKRLHQRLQTTTIYVTHDQEEAMTLGDRVVVMDGGVVQQVGAPMEIYDRPANRFVAGFLGTPSMNFIEGKITANNGKLHFDGAGVLITLTDAQAGCLKNHVGQATILGFRPESLSLRSEVTQSQPLELTVSVIEPLGSAIDAFTTTSAGTRVIARLDAEARLQSNQMATLYLNVARIHVFEPGGHGKNLTLSALGA